MNPKLIATILGVLGYESLEMLDGKVSLSESDVQKMKDAYKAKFGSELVLEGISFDADNHASFLEAEMISIEEAFNQKAPSKPEKQKAEKEESKEVIMLQKTVQELSAKVEKLEADKVSAQNKIIKLGALPEAEEILRKDLKGGLSHSKTHLFASTKAYDAFDNRPWNQRAAGLRVDATDYTPITIDRINEDLGAYYRENQMQLVTFLRNKNRLPAFWNTVSNIQDQVAYAKAFTGEVTQARKKKWLPKGSMEFQPEIAQVHPIQIDVEVAGHELQAMEASWMNHLATINSSGSQPYKMSFVAFMAGEFLKKAAEEDQIGHIRGVLIPTADDATAAGKAIHKQRGLLKAIKEAQVRRVYKPYALGTPTEENIVDYVEKFVKTIPEYWRDMPGMVLYMANYWVDAYLKRREVLKGLMPTYEKDKLTVDRHENIKLVGLPFMNDSKFMFCTTDDNISILENIPNEKSLLTIERSKRDIAIFGDYKIGIHVWAFGYEYPDGVEVTDESQIFFSNDIDILPDQYVDIPANTATPTAKYHTSLKTGVNTAPTAITDILNVSVGEYVYLKGNTGDNPSTIAAAAAKFDLAADITLDENTLLLLYKRGDNDFVEIERWNLELSNVVFLADGATKADADLGNHFVTVANTGATAITTIDNAVDGDIYKIEGGSDTNATTIAKSGDFSRISDAITLEEGNWIKVRYNGEKFVEMDRHVA
jgi:hypothetical protein